MGYMMMLNVKSIVLVVVVWAIIRWLVSEKFLRARRRLPPGPMSLPLIGNLHNLTRNPHKALAELAKIHGPLMFLRFGSLKTVVISSPDVAREVLQTKDTLFSHRMVPDCVRAQNLDDNSITMMPVGDRWRTLRKIATTLLFSTKRLDATQQIRMKKINDLVSYIRTFSEDGVAINIGQVTFNTNLNLLSNILFSMDLADPDSDLSREFKEVSSRLTTAIGKPNLSDLFPIFKGIDPQGIRKFVDTHLRKVLRIFDDIIEKRMVARNDGLAQNNDMLDALLNICHDKSEDFEFQQIRYMLVDIFFAGSETTSNTLEWAMAELLREPNKLKAAQEELCKVVWRAKFIQETDFVRLPYLRAMVNETLRLHLAVTLLVPRKTSIDTEIHGFRVPKNSQVLVNVWAMGRDPSLWQNPNEFKPERFLDSNIDVKGNHFQLLPFGSGRRICAGLPLAIRMLPLMLGNLINFFDWKLEEGMKDGAMNMDEKFGLALQKLTPLYAIPVGLNYNVDSPTLI